MYISNKFLECTYKYICTCICFSRPSYSTFPTSRLCTSSHIHTYMHINHKNNNRFLEITYKNVCMYLLRPYHTAYSLPAELPSTSHRRHASCSSLVAYLPPTFINISIFMHTCIYIYINIFTRICKMPLARTVR
jgi:hypothetical protein